MSHGVTLGERNSPETHPHPFAPGLPQDFNTCYAPQSRSPLCSLRCKRYCLQWGSFSSNSAHDPPAIPTEIQMTSVPPLLLQTRRLDLTGQMFPEAHLLLQTHLEMRLRSHRRTSCARHKSQSKLRSRMTDGCSWQGNQNADQEVHSHHPGLLPQWGGTLFRLEYPLFAQTQNSLEWPKLSTQTQCSQTHCCVLAKDSKTTEAKTSREQQRKQTSHSSHHLKKCIWSADLGAFIWSHLLCLHFTRQVCVSFSPMKASGEVQKLGRLLVVFWFCCSKRISAQRILDIFLMDQHGHLIEYWFNSFRNIYTLTVFYF